MQQKQRKTEKLYRINYYELLGVKRNAKNTEIKSAYDRKMEELNMMDNDYQDKRSKLQVAYKTLRNPKKRRAYNKQFFGLRAKIKRTKKRYDKAYGHKKGIMEVIKRNIGLPIVVSLQHVGDIVHENPKKVLVPVAAATTALAILLSSVFMPKPPKDEESLQKSPAQPPKETITAFHTVEEGDTLSEIAAGYGTTIDLCSGYGSGNSDQIGVGEKITMEIAKDKVPMVTAQTVWLAERDKQSPEGYVSLSYLANLCGTNEDSIKACNVDVETTSVQKIYEDNEDNIRLFNKSVKTPENMETEEKDLYPAGITIKLPFIDGSPLERSVFGNGTIGLAGTDEIFPSGYFASQDPIATEKAPQKVYSLFSSQNTSPLVGGK